MDAKPGDPLDFAIPAWTPGFYQILHFEKGIHNVRAYDSRDSALHVTHPSDRVWHIEADPNAMPDIDPIAARASVSRVTLSYDVDAQDEGLGFFGSALDMSNERGYVNGASALLYPVGQTQIPCTLDLTLPPKWVTATPLQPQTTQTTSNSPASATPPTRFAAANYDDMIDCPLQLGRFEQLQFTEDGAEFQCVLVGKSPTDKTRLSETLRRITHAAVAMFGSAPFARYVFIYHIGGRGFYGGLEHHNSTVIHVPFLPQNGIDNEFASTTAHELFHAWNVKRLHPVGLGPFDYTQPVRTNALWFAEGVTDYYAQLLLVRSGLITREAVWRDMANRIQILDRTPSRVRVSLEEASRKAWEGGSEGFDGLSYYLKGSLVGLYFDLRLRALTHNQASLDDVLRLLDTQYGVKQAAYPEDAILAALNTVAKGDMQPDYARYVQTCEEIDWNTALQPAGMQLLRDPLPFLGLRLAEDQGKNSDGVLVETVEAGQSVARMGLKSGDRLLRLNDMLLTPNNFMATVRGLEPMQSVSLIIRRGETIMSLAGPIGVTYQHHVLTVLPVGRLSAAGLREAKTLLDGMFAPAPFHPVTLPAQPTSVNNTTVHTVRPVSTLTGEQP